MAYFTGCTCGHEPEQHGWGVCDVWIPDPGDPEELGDECPCEGGWEE